MIAPDRSIDPLTRCVHSVVFGKYSAKVQYIPVIVRR